MKWPAAVGGLALAGQPSIAPVVAGSGGGRLSAVGWGLSMGSGGGEAAVGAAGQPPAALMDRPMMGPAQEREVGQVGGAALQPGDQVVALAPGQGSVAVGDDQPRSRTARALCWAG